MKYPHVHGYERGVAKQIAYWCPATFFVRDEWGQIDVEESENYQQRNSDKTSGKSCAIQCPIEKRATHQDGDYGSNPIKGRSQFKCHCAVVWLQSSNDGAEHDVEIPAPRPDQHRHQDHGITRRDRQEPESNADQQSPEDTEQLAFPSIG